MSALDLGVYEASTLRCSLRAQLSTYGIRMHGGVPMLDASNKRGAARYAEHSHIDRLVRLFTRTDRLILGHKQFNADPGYRGSRS